MTRREEAPARGSLVTLTLENMVSGSVYPAKVRVGRKSKRQSRTGELFVVRDSLRAVKSHGVGIDALV